MSRGGPASDDFEMGDQIYMSHRTQPADTAASLLNVEAAWEGVVNLSDTCTFLKGHNSSMGRE